MSEGPPVWIVKHQRGQVSEEQRHRQRIDRMIRYRQEKTRNMPANAPAADHLKGEIVTLQWVKAMLGNVTEAK